MPASQCGDRAVEPCASSAAEATGKGVIGVVAGGSRGTGVVVVHGVAELLSKSLTLETSEPDGRGKVRVDRIVLK
jgi:hypothetical protein